MKIRPATATDFYKTGHIFQYPEGTELVYSNFTPRSAKLKTIPDNIWMNKLVFFGLQYYIKHHLISQWESGFFNQPKDVVVRHYKRRMDTSLGKDAVSVDHIAALHDLRYLPIVIKALPEGSKVSPRVPVMVIYNTLPEFFWLTNYLETALSAMLWKMTTNATIAWHYKKLFDRYADLTGCTRDFTPFQGHDFSFRGMSNIQDAAMSGAAHLTSFYGTDSIPAIDLLEDYYNGDAEKELIGCSVPATEHSVMCMGEKDNEIETFRNIITKVYPAGIVSIVSDTWDFWKVITYYAAQLKPEILAREGKVVFRPDSGDPVDIVCGEAIYFEVMPGQGKERSDLATAGRKMQVGDRFYDVRITEKRNSSAQEYFHTHGFHETDVEEVYPTPRLMGAMECLWQLFGGTRTSTGHRILNEKVGLIYGDSITLERANAILQRLKNKGFASSNIVFGIGSFTYQHVTRDTFGFAVKSTYGKVKGQPRFLFKDPVTDSGAKKSAKGLIAVKEVEGEFQLVDGVARFDEPGDCLREVFRDGNLLVEDTISKIRERVAK